MAAQQNINVVTGPLTGGWPKGRLMTPSSSKGRQRRRLRFFCPELKEGGRLACILGGGPGAKAILYFRSGNELGGRAIFDASAAVLPGFAKAPAFAF